MTRSEWPRAPVRLCSQSRKDCSNSAFARCWHLCWSRQWRQQGVARDMSINVICLPGGVAPALQRYGPRMEVGDGRAELHLKDHELYRGDTPPADYSVELELEAVDRFADSRGLDRFHLVGYSGGGFLSLAYAGTRPRRLRSLAIFAPARVPGKPTEDEQAATDSLSAQLEGLEGGAFMAAFVQAQLKPGVAAPPPPARAAPGMEKRPAGIAAMTRAFTAYCFYRDRLRG